MADNAIALGIKQPEPVNYLGQAAQVMALKAAQNEMQGNDQMRAAYGSGSGDWSDPAFKRQMYMANPKTASLMEEHAAKTKQDQLAGTKAKLGLLGQLSGGIIANPTPENLQATLAQAVQYGLTTPQEAQAQLAKLGGDPTAIKAWGEQHQRSALDAEKQLPKIEMKDLGGTMGTFAIDPVTGQVKKTYTENKTQSPDNAASVGAAMYGHNITARGQDMLDQRAKDRLASDEAVPTLNDNAVDNLANQFNLTGTLPTFGMGKKAAEMRAKVINRATEIGMGSTPPPAAPVAVAPPPQVAAPPVAGPAPQPNALAAPGTPTNALAAPPTPPVSAANLAATTVGNKIDNAAQRSTVRDFTSGMSARKVDSLNTAVDHLDTLGKLATALQNGDTRAINYLGNEVAKQTGQPAPTSFDAAKQIVGQEVVKAIVANGGGEREREEAARHLSSANSPEQLAGTIATLQNLMGGQLSSLKLRYEGVTGRKDFETKLSEPTKRLFADRVKPTGDTTTSAAPAKADAGKSVVRTGTLNGRKVVEYSDGTHGYAD